MTKLFDRGPVPEGVFKLKAYNTNGQLIRSICDKNMVVNGGRAALAHLLGHDIVGGHPTYYVDTLKIGNGGHNISDPTEMLPVSVEDSHLYADDLGAEGYTLTAGELTVTFPDDIPGPSPPFAASNKVEFSVTIDTDEGNHTGSQPYSEAGLFYNSGAIMFAHKSFGYIIKNSTIRLVITWTFTF